MVPRGDRSGSVIEPYLTDQWYVKVAPLAEEAVKAVESGKSALSRTTGAVPIMSG